MQFKRRAIAAAIIGCAAATPGLALATNGYFSHGYGTKDKGMAGAGVALPQDAMVAATNPAGMAYVGSRMDLGLAVFSPRREYTATGTSGPQPPPAFNLENGTYSSDNNYFFIPHFAYNHPLDADSAVGITVYGNGGMNTKYPANKTPSGMGTFYGGDAGVDLSQLFVAGTYARKVTPQVGLGVSAILAYQRFKAEGLKNFAGYSSDPSNLTNNGYDTSTGGGLRIGGQFDVSPMVSLGVSYQTKMRMSKFKKYAGLFADGGRFDIPATWVVGAAFKATPKNTIVFDVQRIEYSGVKSIANPMQPSLNNCAGGNTSNCLGGSNGPGFGWRDMTVYKLGYQGEVSPDLTVRVGYSKARQPIPSSEVLFNILAPGVMEEHYTAGLTWAVDKSNEINVAGMYAPRKTVSGANPLAAGGQNIALSMKQYELEVSWGMKF